MQIQRLLPLSIALILSLSPFFGNSQKYASVVELFTHTGAPQAVSAINSMNANWQLSEAERDNHVYIQYHADTTVSGWSDGFVTADATSRFQEYITQGLISGLTDIAKNGEVSSATPMYNSDPLEKEIYYGGSKCMNVLFDSYDASNQELVIRFTLATKYTSGKSVHIFALEDSIDLNITGGPNAGSTVQLNNVFRNARTVSADVYTDTVHLVLPAGTNVNNARIVAYMRDDANYEILSATRGFVLDDYLQAPGTTFAVVENFINTGCYGGPPANSSMYNFAQAAEQNTENEIMVQLHIGQIYGNWSDVYKLPLNGARYDTYSWDMGILAGLAAVGKNGIRYKAQSWNDCSPLHKIETAFVDLTPVLLDNQTLTVDYTLSGALHPYDRVYFYVVERGITVNVTGGEIPGTTFNMNNVARVARYKEANIVSDTVQLQIPSNVILDSARVVAYIQNDRTYEITGGTKGFKLNSLASIGLNDLTYGDEQFLLYPNPTDDQVSILFPQHQQGKTSDLRIYDLASNMVYCQQIDSTPSLLVVSDLQLMPGIYLVQINGTSRRLEVF